MLEKTISLERKAIIITGCAGFIGAALTEELLKRDDGIQIIGIDNMNDYYEVSLKEYRLKKIQDMMPMVSGTFTFLKGNIADKKFVNAVFKQYSPDIVINLAAQAGVRYSIDHPDVYIESNIIGFYNILEACRHSIEQRKNGIEHLVYASSSSVYGNNKKIPYEVEDKTDCPVSLYAATKKADELLAYSYAKLYRIPMTGLRFFTVYGPAGRPDMAYYSFADKMVQKREIRLFNYGNCKRDFTYIDDIVGAIRLVAQSSPLADSNGVRYKVYNIGNGEPVNLLDFVHILAGELKKTSVLDRKYSVENYIELVGMQPGDVEITYADVSALESDFGFRPSTNLQEGLCEFAKWYSSFYEKQGE